MYAFYFSKVKTSEVGVGQDSLVSFIPELLASRTVPT